MTEEILVVKDSSTKTSLPQNHKDNIIQQSEIEINSNITKALEYFTNELTVNDGEINDQNKKSDVNNNVVDVGEKKRRRNVRSPRASIYYKAEEARCRRCNCQKEKLGQYCYYCEQLTYLHINSSSQQPSSSFVNQNIPGFEMTGMLEFQNGKIPVSSAYTLLGIPPSISALFPQYCSPVQETAILIKDESLEQQPHRRPSAEIAAALVKTKVPPPDLSNIDPNLDLFQHDVFEDQKHNTPVVEKSKSRKPAKHCKYRGCKNPTENDLPYCAPHAISRKCQHEGCTKCAQGSTKLCIAHGGGRRCTFPGCTKGARDKFFCAGHGGGKRCEVEGCTKSAVGSSFCTNHGGGKRCKEPGCQKSAQSSTPYCVRHGGGRKCCVPGCSKVWSFYLLSNSHQSARGRNNYCAVHLLDPQSDTSPPTERSDSPEIFEDQSLDEIKCDSDDSVLSSCDSNDLLKTMNFTKLKIKLKS